MKLFFAIEPDEPTRGALLGLQAALRAATCAEAAEPPPGITWSTREQLHVTLQYLGSVADPAPVVAAARAAFAGHAPFDLALGPLGSFGDSAPRVVWAGLAGEGLPRLHALQASLAERLAPLGLVPDQDEYRPHLTLARVRGESGSSKGRSKKRPPAATSVRREGAQALARAIAAAAAPGAGASGAPEAPTGPLPGASSVPEAPTGPLARPSAMPGSPRPVGVEALGPGGGPLPGASFRVAEVVLFESRQGQGGPVYLPVERLPLS